MSKSVLLIFTKNPELGKCKTRLASTLGNEKALEIYNQLLDHTRELSARVDSDKHVYYSKSIPKSDRWSSSIFEKHLQIDGDLGEKMNHAFKESFTAGYEKAIIIGSDCAEINEEDIEVALKSLNDHDVVIGPAVDGGYYLLGMRKLHSFLFHNKSWSTPNLIKETLTDLQKHNKSFKLLEEKSDVDYEEDLRREGYINFKH